MQRNAIEPVPSWPRCFTGEKQYRAWLLSAARMPPGDSQYCADCTPQFQAQRIRQSRCAFPGTTFHVNAEGFLDGVRPGSRMAPRTQTNEHDQR